MKTPSASSPSFNLPSHYEEELLKQARAMPFTKFLPSEGQLGALLDLAFFAGIHSEEGRAVTFTAALLSCEDARTLKPGYQVVEFQKPLNATPESIAKLSLATDPLRTQIGLSIVGDVVKAWGLIQPPPSPFSRQKTDSKRRGFPYLVVRAVRPGVVRVIAPGRVLLEYKRGDALFPDQDFDKMVADMALVVPLLRLDALYQLQLGMLAHSHGGAIFVLPAGAPAFEEKFAGIKHSTLRMTPPSEAEIAHANGADPVSEDFVESVNAQIANRWPSHLATLAGATAIDGAVLIDSNLGLLGFGAFVAAPTPNETVPVLDRRGSAYDRNRRGARHRSAIWFCEHWPDALALVVSQDGDTSVFVRKDGQHITWAPIADPD